MTATDTAAPPSIRTHEALRATGLVAVWTALGFLLPPDPNLYLVAGVPLTFGYQALVRRRPIRELWVRAAARFTWDRRTDLVAAALAAVPVLSLVQAVAAGQWVVAGWMAAAVAGAVPAAWALRQARREDLRTWAGWVALCTAVGVAVVALLMVPQAAAAGWPGTPVERLLAALEAVVLYVPVQFLLEEVSFRGLLDTAVHDEGATRQWPSAVLVSALWGLWHLPVAVTGLPLWATAGLMLAVHIPIGVPLSLAWRRTGTLLVPVLAHALIDAFRNAVSIGLGPS